MGEKAKAVSPSETIDSFFLEGDEKTQGIKWPRAGASDELTNESLDLGVVHSQSKQVVEILEGLVVFGVEFFGSPESKVGSSKIVKFAKRSLTIHKNSLLVNQNHKNQILLEIVQHEQRESDVTSTDNRA